MFINRFKKYERYFMMRKLLILNVILLNLIFQAPLAANTLATEQLFQGINENNLSKIEQALKEGADINYQRPEDLATPIMVSVHKVCNDLKAEKKFKPESLKQLAVVLGLLVGGTCVVKQFEAQHQLIKKWGSLAVVLMVTGYMGYQVFTAPRQASDYSFEIFEKCTQHSTVNLSLTDKQQRTVLQILDSYRSVFTTWDRYLYHDMKELLQGTAKKQLKK